MSTDTTLSKSDKTIKAAADKHNAPVTLIDFMAGIAFLGYAVNKFENIHIPEGGTLGEEVSRESYEWAKAMCGAKKDV